MKSSKYADPLACNVHSPELSRHLAELDRFESITLGMDYIDPWLYKDYLYPWALMRKKEVQDGEDEMV